MKDQVTTIKERANKYARARVDKVTRIFPELEETTQMLRDLIAQSHIAGAESEHAELTRWNDPKEHPEKGKMVLVKRTADSPLAYDLAHVANGELVDSWCGEIDLGDKIVGWREIHE